MIVVDANLLIYAYDLHSASHKKSLLWLEGAFSGVEAVGLPSQNKSAFLRVITSRRVSGARVGVERAVQIVEEWLQLSNGKGYLCPVINTGQS